MQERDLTAPELWTSCSQLSHSREETLKDETLDTPNHLNQLHCLAPLYVSVSHPPLTPSLCCRMGLISWFGHQLSTLTEINGS